MTNLFEVRKKKKEVLDRINKYIKANPNTSLPEFAGVLSEFMEGRNSLETPKKGETSNQAEVASVEEIKEYIETLSPGEQKIYQQGLIAYKQLVGDSVDELQHTGKYDKLMALPKKAWNIAWKGSALGISVTQGILKFAPHLPASIGGAIVGSLPNMGFTEKVALVGLIGTELSSGMGLVAGALAGVTVLSLIKGGQAAVTAAYKKLKERKMEEPSR